MFNLKRTPGDIAFSLFIRYKAGWTCERCRRPYPVGSGNLQCSHFYGRGGKSTRCDEENAAALDGGCHQYFTANPEDHRAFFLRRLGEEKFYALVRRAHLPCRYYDDRAHALGYRERLRVEFGVGAAYFDPSA